MDPQLAWHLPHECLYTSVWGGFQVSPCFPITQAWGELTLFKNNFQWPETKPFLLSKPPTPSKLLSCVEVAADLKPSSAFLPTMSCTYPLSLSLPLSLFLPFSLSFSLRLEQFSWWEGVKQSQFALMHTEVIPWDCEMFPIIAVGTEGDILVSEGETSGCEEVTVGKIINPVRL